ncbi:DUF3192 domain-containing protein [Aliidiomarina indica]|uniref:DUF3192 domain-containing protein n=1 Tax=Aliidiomarina indica TaxID=2749147 RepID=UPI00188F7FE2|nr:DUF3192 domain-containing protein [Aliidiomarina indica]
MKSVMLLTAGFLSISLLSGCVVVVDGDKRVSKESVSFEAREESNRAAIAQLKMGTSPSAVLMAMGTPDFDERLSRGGVDYRVLYYRTQRVAADGMTTKDECTPLVFANGELLGWGFSKLDLIERG